MGMSLQDQLLKSGLADKKQAKKAKQEKRIKRKKNKGKKAAPPKANQAQQERQAQAERNRELNRQRNLEKEKQAKAAQVRQLIETSRLDLKKYEDPYYFKLGTKIKKLYVNDDIAEKLSRGQLAIVTLDGLFEVVPAAIATQIAQRDPDALVVRHAPET